MVTENDAWHMTHDTRHKPKHHRNLNDAVPAVVKLTKQKRGVLAAFALQIMTVTLGCTPVIVVTLTVAVVAIVLLLFILTVVRRVGIDISRRIWTARINVHTLQLMLLMLSFWV